MNLRYYFIKDVICDKVPPVTRQDIWKKTQKINTRNTPKDRVKNAYSSTHHMADESVQTCSTLWEHGTELLAPLYILICCQVLKISYRNDFLP